MKWLVLILLAIGIYHFGFNQQKGEFDEAGNPKIVLFVMDGCPPCDDAVSLLKRLRLDFEVLKPTSDASAQQRYDQYSTRQFPLLVIGDTKSTGYSQHQYTATLGKAFGLEKLPRAQQRVYQSHFNGSKPKIVMYGTSWCQYCKKARDEFDKDGFDYVEWDVERDPSAMSRFKQLGGTGYPLIYVGFDRFNQVNKSQIKKALAYEL